MMVASHLGHVAEKGAAEGGAVDASAAAAAAALAAIEADLRGLPPPPVHPKGSRAAITEELMQVSSGVDRGARAGEQWC